MPDFPIHRITGESKMAANSTVAQTKGNVANKYNIHAHSFHVNSVYK